MEKDKEMFVELEKQEYDRIEKLDINNKVKTSFLNYAMSVIIARALPDARDGMKPVQRRILYGMNELKIYANVAHKKSARIVGDVMGKYHPHGDSSIYDAMVRMAQPFSYRYALVDGHGNFGNIDGDGAAAMRYTEARMSKIAMEMLRDIDKNTVNFQDNYDSTEIEPEVLPAKFPNLLVNGATGIAVGMATNIPPHNLGEVIDGVIAVIHNPEITSEELMEYITGPDFPTGGLILGRTGLRNAYTTGNGSIIIRSKASIETLKNGKTEIIVTEIPYMTNKTRLIERIAEVAKNKIVDGITDLRDESGRGGIRIVIELRKDVNAEVMLNNLYKYTQLQTSYGMNMICLVDNQPKSITLKEALVVYLKHQMNIITRRTQYDLDKALARIHILDGYIIAQNNIDEIIKIIRETTDGSEKEKLMMKYQLSDLQAQAILDMQLRRLSGLNREKVLQEHQDLTKACEEYRTILADDTKKQEIIQNELLDIKNRYNDPRKSEICLSTDLNIENEDLIPREDVVITITSKGYAKRMKQDTYKTQSRGGVGMAGIKTNENDDVAHIIATNTHDYLLFFTNKGRVYAIKGYQIPETSRTAKGLPLVNILSFQSDEQLAAITRIKSLDDDNSYLFFATKKGTVKRTVVSQFKNIRTSGIIAINLAEDDELLQVELTDGQREIVLGASNGKAIRFNENDVRPIGRSAAGVRGMDFAKNDFLVGMAIVTEEQNQILVVTEKGFGKRSDIDEYRLQGRGGMGVKALNVTEKNGKLTTLRSVGENNDLIITTDRGMIIRMHVSSISETGRNTQGVILIKLKDDQKIATVAIVERQEEDKEEIEAVESNTDETVVVESSVDETVAVE